MKWLVNGAWERTGDAGTITVTAESMRGAFDVAKSRGLVPTEAVQTSVVARLETAAAPIGSARVMFAIAIGSAVASIPCCLFAAILNSGVSFTLAAVCLVVAMTCSVAGFVLAR